MRRGVSKAELAELRKRAPAPRIPILVIRTVVDPRSDGSPPVIGPRTAMHEAMIAAAWAAIKADGKNRRLIVDSADARG